MQAKRFTIAVFISALALLVLCAAARAEKHPPAKPIDLNLANVKELQELPGVGPVTAQRIIDMRERAAVFTASRICSPFAASAKRNSTRCGRTSPFPRRPRPRPPHRKAAPREEGESSVATLNPRTLSSVSRAKEF